MTSRSFLGRYSLGARLAMALFALLLVGLVAYTAQRFSGMGRSAMIATRVQLAARNINDLAEGLTSYSDAAGSTLPMMMTEDGPTLNQEWIDANPSLFGRFVQGDVTDPFAEDPYTYLRYWTDGKAWTIWSMGPDRDYDLTDPAVYATPGLAEATAAIADDVYDLSRGLSSDGDIIQLYRPAPEE